METQQIEEIKEETPKESGGILNDFMEICESVVTSIFVVLLVFAFICRPVTVDGDSMNPTLLNEDKLVMMTFLYTPKNGDIVIVKNDEAHYYQRDSENIITRPGLGKRLIKRVIATEGQTVDIDFDMGIVKVDGKVLSENYIKAPTHRDSGAFTYPLTVPEGYIFVMGDNRNNSTDSRHPSVGFVKKEDVLGKAVMRFYPFEKLEIL